MMPVSSQTSAAGGMGSGLSRRTFLRSAGAAALSLASPPAVRAATGPARLPTRNRPAALLFGELDDKIQAAMAK